MNRRTGDSIEATMRRVEAQPALFAPRISRLAVQSLELPEDGAREFTVNVWRNHAIEPVVALARPYMAFGRWQAEFRIGDYDDSLGFNGRADADLELLWLDSQRYLAAMSFADWLEWLRGRVVALRAMTKAPIVVATWLPEGEGNAAKMQAMADALPAVFFADLGALCAEADVRLLDARTAAVAGTPVSNAAQPLIARKLACHWLAAALLSPVKALALDLDHTLHKGVLGEDGVEGVELTDGHRELQAYVKSLRDRGIFLALVSKNDPADVEKLFNVRADFVLRWSDFSATEVGWNDKASAIARIADTLRIGSDAILFVDDNPGELAQVAAAMPEVHSVCAAADASLTQRAIQFYPGLWRWRVEADDAKRVLDLQANAEREALLQQAADPAEYFRSLQVSLRYRRDPQDQLGRLADLCNKTNQFNLAMRRFTEAEVAERLQRADACVASVQMNDRLSDSGVVAVVIAERHGTTLSVEELCVSCRAMGRQLEDTMILLAIRSMPQFDGCTEVTFKVQHGPRNEPALAWLAKLLGSDGAPAVGTHAVPADVLRKFAPMDSITIYEEASAS